MKPNMLPRWKTFSPGIPREEAERSGYVSRIERWWESFSARSADITASFSRDKRMDLPQWMKENLQSIVPNLMWEFGPGSTAGHRLVVTPEYRHDLRPLVDEILGRAPSIEGWSFFGHRLRETLDMAQTLVESRTGTPLRATGFDCERGRFNLVDVSVEFPSSMIRSDNRLARHQAFVLLESALGEAVLNEWVGEIGVEPATGRSRRLEGLPAAVDEAIAEIIGELPKRPLFADKEAATGTVMKADPSPADDYPSQTDLLVGTTLNEELWRNARSNVPFFSRRYSACGEMFCYLKMDGKDLTGEIFRDKAEIEDAIDGRLLGDRSGCFVGGGTGLRYSYVDLALTDVPRAIPAIREVLRAGRITRRSWLLFHDSEWRHEWVGIWDDSPPPPAEPSDHS